MIVVDENLSDSLIIKAIASSYAGQVVPITDLRPHSIIKDDAISTLLLQVDQPTFVTINVADFWKKASPHSRYSIVCIAVPQDRAMDSLELLRPFLRLSTFRAKASRMGRVFHLIASHVEYYATDKKIHRVSWLE